MFRCIRSNKHIGSLGSTRERSLLNISGFLALREQNVSPDVSNDAASCQNGAIKDQDRKWDFTIPPIVDVSMSCTRSA